MRAVVYDRYGPPERLHLREVDEPQVKPDGVLVRVMASSINSWDGDLLSGRFPRSGQRRPKIKILGADISGVVEKVGRDVRGLQPGDEAYGDLSRHRFGGFAEYVSVPERALAAKSAAMTFEQAAAMPQAAGLALQALRKGRIRSGHRVVFNGAGGGVGTFGIQLAKSHGAEVTGVDASDKFEGMRSVGADHVIDYRKQDFAAGGESYDLIVDVMASRSAREYARALRPGGRCVLVGGPSNLRLLRLAVFGSLLMPGDRKVGLLLYKPSNEDLLHLNEQFESGKVTPLIDSTYPLSRAREAMQRFVDGGFAGKIVITVAGDPG
jgi:NADPH:quinone reductase-like Zn-dependent oxidoreductase